MYTVESPAVVRVAGMPIHAVTGLRFDETMRRVGDLLDRDAWLDEEGERLGARLYDLIGDERRSAVKPALVGLRRAIHRHRPPRRAAFDETVRAALPDDLAGDIRRWIDRLEERDRWLASLPAALATETAIKVRALRATVADPRFRHALVQTGSPLSEALEAWLARGDDRSPGWPVVRRLAKYLSRAALKTSPYSTFTTSGLAAWVDRDGGVRPAIQFRRDLEPCGLLELHGGVLPALEQALAERSDLRGALRIRLNPSAHESDGTVSFLGRPPREPIVTLRATPEVRACIRLAIDHPWSTMDAFRAGLAAEPGAEPAVTAYVDRLVDAGLLELRLGIADQADDPLGDLADWLETAGNGGDGKTATVCRALRDEVRRPTRADTVEEHRARLSAISDHIDGLGEAFGRAWAGTGLAGPATHENMVYGQPAADLDTAAWRPALDDLDAVRRWAGLFEPGLPLLVALGEYARQRFASAEIPFVRFYQVLHGDLARTDDRLDGDADTIADLRALLGPSAGLPAARLPRLRELNRKRAESARAVLTHPPSSDGVVRLDPAELVAGYGYAAAPASVACYVQPVSRGGRLGLVLNAIASGYGRGRGRWYRLVARAAEGDILPPAPADAGPDVLLAESHGAFGHALNLRRPLTPYHLEYPHTVGEHPAGRGFALRDLVVRYDARTARLRLGAVGVAGEVRPVHGGLTAEYALPPALQLLIRAFGSPTVLHPAMPVLSSGLPDPLRQADRIVAMPRVDVGLVTLRRAAWLAPSACVPRRDKGESDGAFLLRVHSWLRRHRIPTRCFVRPIEALDTSVRRIVVSKARKPLYIDFECWFLVAVFERLVRDPAELVLFTEVLPAPEDALAPGPSACEAIVELTAGERIDA